MEAHIISNSSPHLFSVDDMKLFSKKVEGIKNRLQEDDPIWTYTVNYGSEDSEYAVIQIHDEGGLFLGYV